MVDSPRITINGVELPGEAAPPAPSSVEAAGGMDDRHALGQVEEDFQSLADLLSEAAQADRTEDAASLLSSKASLDFLNRITSLSLETLKGEPGALKKEAASIDTELTNLCFRQYRTFIDVHKSSADISAAFDRVDVSLDDLLSRSMPAFENECQAFAEATATSQLDRRRASLVLEHHDKLLDVLDIPRLVDTCVRSGYYNEALDLSSHARTLAQRFGDIPLVLDIEAEVRAAMQVMLAQLLSLLREPIKLPAAVKTVNLLRRMGQLSEHELGIAFLASRQNHWQQQLMTLERERGDPARYVKKYVDVFREYVYDIVTQYSSIFVEHAYDWSRRSIDDATALKQAEEPSYLLTPPQVVLAYADHAIESLLQTLDHFVPLITDTASLSSLYTQLGYCATSFGRVGLDFRHLIAAPFERAAKEEVTRIMGESVRELEKVIGSAERARKLPSSWVCVEEDKARIIGEPLPSLPPLDGTLLKPQDESAPVHQPPQLLIDFPPLASFLNGHLNALNALRLFAPLSILDHVEASLLSSLASSARALRAHAEMLIAEPDHSQSEERLYPPNVWGEDEEERRGRRKDELKLYAHLLNAFTVELVPYLVRALREGVYGIGYEEQRTQVERRSAWVDNATDDKMTGDEEPSAAEELCEQLSKVRTWISSNVEVGGDEP